jgi:hypothetical protein
VSPAPARRRLRAAAGLVISLAIGVSACAPAASSGSPVGSGAASPVADQAFERVQGPPPGPVKPFRGEMVQHVRIVDGYISMFFELSNIGEEPVTFLNTLYDYEPDQLYTPAVRLEWEEGGNLVYTRSGRFFPSPAILQPGESGAYLMGGQPVSGDGEVGDLVTHIKYCPTRGMDDLPSIPLRVDELAWSVEDGVTTVSGTLTQEAGAARPGSPTVGVAFFDATGTFAGAVVAPTAGQALEVGVPAGFEISGRGVAAGGIAEARAFAWVA